MVLSKKINLFKAHYNFIVFLVCFKLVFAYLSIELSYWQRDLIPNFERFNFFDFPKHISNTTEYILLPFMMVFCLLYWRYLRKYQELLLVIGAMMMLNLLTAIINALDVLGSLNLSLKLFSGVLFFCSLIIYHNKTEQSVQKSFLLILKLCTALVIIALLFFDPSFNRLEEYLPIFFSGIHTHSYVLVCLFVGVLSILHSNRKRRYLILFSVLSTLFLYLGYNVRTALLMYLFVLVPVLFYTSDLFKLIIFKAFLLTPFVLFFIYLIGTELQLDNFSSGRLSMYAAKFQVLSNYSIIDWLVGKGYGSDLITTESWWWSKKGSHSDLLTFLVENGILYLILFFLFIIRILHIKKQSNFIILFFVFGAFFTSLISNGVLVRPTSSYVFFLVLAMITTDYNQRTNQLKQQ